MHIFMCIHVYVYVYVYIYIYVYICCIYMHPPPLLPTSPKGGCSSKTSRVM